VRGSFRLEFYHDIENEKAGLDAQAPCVPPGEFTPNPSLVCPEQSSAADRCTSGWSLVRRRLAVDTHAITSSVARPRRIKTPGGLVAEVTDRTEVCHRRARRRPTRRRHRLALTPAADPSHGSAALRGRHSPRHGSCSRSWLVSTACRPYSCAAYAAINPSASSVTPNHSLKRTAKG
jgi:hypothetical protein